ncbi:hypothetical protein [Mucilaginibacter lacusdianchii]|uniref:hypothetical protein n=1 Tax=Mucilaginibacter lacusdianchii TaxID=2684211 RepID=UPI00131B5867|nr:hypothetical protein [Mucilaginibacter sp. JXJ CY 39]
MEADTFEARWRNKILSFGGVIVLIIIIILYLHDRKLDQYLDNGGSVQVVAKITRKLSFRGTTYIDVEFDYNGKKFKSDFGTSDVHADSLKEGDKVRLLVSKKQPIENFRYIGVGEEAPDLDSQ